MFFFLFIAVPYDEEIAEIAFFNVLLLAVISSPLISYFNSKRRRSNNNFDRTVHTVPMIILVAVTTIFIAFVWEFMIEPLFFKHALDSIEEESLKLKIQFVILIAMFASFSGVIVFVWINRLSDRNNWDITNTLTLIEMANAPIFGVNAEGRINVWNRRAEKITGYTKQEVMHCKLVDEFIIQEHKASVKEVLEKALRGEETADNELPIETKSGDRVDVLFNSTTRRDGSGKIVGVIGIGQDITERNLIDLEREKLIQILENLDQCVVLFDEDERIVFCNDAYRKLNESFIDFTNPGTMFEDHLRAGVRARVIVDGIGREEEWVAKRLAYHRNPKGSFEVSRQDGTTILLNEKILPDTGTILVITDITDLKVSQAQVVQASKLATLGEMATSVAHELNQPLNTIRMAVSNIADSIELGKATPEYLLSKVKRIDGQIERTSSIINHMRMFGRIADEKPERLDPREVMKGALGMMGEQLRLASIEVTASCDHECPIIIGHKIQLEQVFLNLFANARDAINENKENTDRKIVILGTPIGNDKLEISFTDTGGGVPQNILPHVFEPFFTTKEMHKGTGLGLSVSYGIIRDMGGTFKVENVNGGARFAITLPIEE
jgi:PAS domain S-box-containing protein